MIRNLVLLLLFTNLLALAWQLWIAPDDHPDPFAVDNATIPVLERWSRAPVAPASDSAKSSPLLCERIGPFDDLGDVDALRSALRDQVETIERVSEPGEAWVGHWVQVIGLETRAAGEDAVARLVNAGIADAYIVQFEPSLDVSLGVYRSLERAQNVVDMAAGLGLAAIMEDRVRPTVEHWLVVPVAAAGGALELDGIELPAGQILRREEVECEPDEVDEGLVDGVRNEPLSG